MEDLGVQEGPQLDLSPVDIPSTALNRRPPRLCLQNKSFSLDSPDPVPHLDYRQIFNSSGRVDHMGRSPFYHSPSSPTHPTRRLLGHNSPHSNGSRQDLYDQPQSPQILSPCISPKPGRYLPSNLYVLLYDFQPRRTDDLELSAGDTIQILDTSDSDWWRGRCTLNGDVGYVPSTYLARLGPGERVHRVTQHCTMLGEGGILHTLHRDQILISLAGDWEDTEPGSILVRNGDSSLPIRGTVPLHYLYSV